MKGETRMKKLWAIFVLEVTLLAGCGKSGVINTYQPSEGNGVVKTYYEMDDGTWLCNQKNYQYRLELTGRMPTAQEDSCYVVLTDRDDLTFEDVSKSLYSSLLKDSEVMKGSIIVEMK